jgi:hypothetical protein
MPKKEISGAKHVQPCFVEPMQVAPVRELTDGGAWTYEAQLDGYRVPGRTGVDPEPARMFKGFKRHVQYSEALENAEATTKLYNEIFNIR